MSINCKHLFSILVLGAGLSVFAAPARAADRPAPSSRWAPRSVSRMRLPRRTVAPHLASMATTPAPFVQPGNGGAIMRERAAFMSLLQAQPKTVLSAMIQQTGARIDRRVRGTLEQNLAVLDGVNVNVQRYVGGPLNGQIARITGKVKVGYPKHAEAGKQQTRWVDVAVTPPRADAGQAGALFDAVENLFK